MKIAGFIHINKLRKPRIPDTDCFIPTYFFILMKSIFIAHAMLNQQMNSFFFHFLNLMPPQLVPCSFDYCNYDRKIMILYFHSVPFSLAASKTKYNFC